MLASACLRPSYAGLLSELARWVAGICVSIALQRVRACEPSMSLLDSATTAIKNSGPIVLRDMNTT